VTTPAERAECRLLENGLRAAIRALDSAWAAIGDALMSGKGISEAYAKAVAGDVRCARIAAEAAFSAPPQPDLAALDAAVAEAADKWVDAFSYTEMETWCSDSRNLRSTALAKRAALKPKPRYEVNLLGVYDHKERRFMQPEEVAALLNAKEPKP
jgi:hypothetical protein